MTAVGNLDMAVIPTAVAVASETDPDTVYQVQLPYCPCKAVPARPLRRRL